MRTEDQRGQCGNGYIGLLPAAASCCALWTDGPGAGVVVKQIILDGDRDLARTAAAGGKQSLEIERPHPAFVALAGYEEWKHFCTSIGTML